MTRRRVLTDKGCAAILLGVGVFFALLVVILEPGNPLPASHQRPQNFQKKAGKTQAPGPKQPAVPAPERTGWIDVPEEATSAVAAVDWQEVFRDDFTRSELGKNWKVGTGEWSLQENRLLCSETTGNPNIIICTSVEFAGTFQISYEAMSTSVKPVDLSFMSHLLDQGITSSTSGYLFQFGGWDNTNTNFATGRDYMGLAKTDNTPIVTGKVHQVVISSVGAYQVMSIDGKQIFAGKLDHPIELKEYHLGGFYVFRGPSSFDNVVVRKPKGTAATLPGTKK